MYVYEISRSIGAFDSNDFEIAIDHMIDGQLNGITVYARIAHQTYNKIGAIIIIYCLSVYVEYDWKCG